MSNYVKVYRGTHGGRWYNWPENPTTVRNEAGIHWTSDPIVAYHFARHGALATHQMNHPENLLPRDMLHSFTTTQHGVLGGNDYTIRPELGTIELRHPMVLEGWAHKSSVVDPMHSEWKDLAETHRIYPPSADEQQVTLRPGSKVHISKVHMIGPQFDVRSFGIPRQLQIRKFDEDNED